MIPVKEFFTGGRAVFTLEVPEEFALANKTKNHYTYRIRLKKGNDKYPDTYFVDLLSGPDNESNYAYLGILNPKTGQFALTAKSKAGDDSWSVRFFRRSMAAIFEGNSEAITNAGFNLHHEGKCGRCGRKLTVPESIKTGLGPICSGDI
jgi:hypothetical protein